MSNREVELPTAPHDRELLDLLRLCMEAYEDSNFLAVIITETREHHRFLLKTIRDATSWDTPGTKLLRDGIEVKGGGRIVFRSSGDPGMLMGLRPTKVVLAGRIGEMYHHIHSMQCPVETIA